MEREEILWGRKGSPANGFPSTASRQETMKGKEKAEGASEPAFAGILFGSC